MKLFNGYKKHDFKIGDVVRLKCGGFPMVVHRVKGIRITCVWQHIEGEAFEMIFDYRIICHNN